MLASWSFKMEPVTCSQQEKPYKEKKKKLSILEEHPY